MIQIKDFTNYKCISGLEFSDDKKNLGFLVHQATLEENKYISHIWVYNQKNRDYKQLTYGGKETLFRWLDSQTILYPVFKNRSDDDIKAGVGYSTLLNQLNIDNKTVEPYCDIPLKINNFEPIGNERFVVTAEYAVDDSSTRQNEFQVIDEIPFWSDGKGFTNKKRNRLYVFDKATDQLIAITEELTNVTFFTVYDNVVTYVGKTYTDRNNLIPGIYQYDLETKKTTTILAEDLYKVEHVNWLCGKMFFIGACAKTSLATDNPKFYMIEEGQVKLWLDPDFSCRDTVMSECRYGESNTTRVFKDHLYLVSTHERSSFINKISIDGTVERLTADNGSIDGFDISEDEILFTGLRGVDLQEIYSVKDQVENPLTQFNQGVLDIDHISVPEAMVFENNGFQVHYVVVKPLTFDENKKYPAILYIHGGAKVIYGKVFFHEMQLLASKGYFVIYGNPRGSDGQGSEFAKLQGQYGIPDYSDMMKSVDVALAKYPQIDEGRLGVVGGSYGGIMTNWIIGHTDRFKSAVSQRSLCNMISAFGTADNGFNFVAEQMASTPWDNMDLLWHQSPLKYADKVKTATLFIHSEEDYRCHYSESLQMFTALKYHGIDSRVCLIKGESHGLSRTGRPRNRIKRLEEITNWLDKYLKQS
ncbi:MAG: S9 family peptidase [Eubacteriales bacterium]|nr:S9 family peptidase [Eubacteriales bacterium]